MCGIGGWSAAPGVDPPLENLRAMSTAMLHRGPDGSGEWIDSARGIALTHRRLAIIDLTDRSAQPFVDEAGNVLCYNGELYNFRRLRDELAFGGLSFSTDGDVEVVAKALRAWGRAALGRFCGMFALAYVPAGSSRILLARDPAGIKPLFIARRQGRKVTYFASELRAVTSPNGVERRIGRDALRQFLEFGYVFDGRKALLEGVEKVRPGEWVELEAGEIIDRSRYFELPCSTQEDCDEGRHDLCDLLETVVKEHLVADVPVGVLLSGGLDSSVLAAIAARFSQVSTVSFGFAESNTDERPQARSVAAAIGAKHTEFLIDPGEAVNELQTNASAMDDLIADGAIFSNMLAYRASRALGLKVVLVGEGADELFGGYPIFADAVKLRGPSAWRRFQLYRRYAGLRYGNQFGNFSREFGNVLKGEPCAWVDAVRRFEVTRQLANQYVVKVDRASMTESIEARTPYLDRRVVAAAMRIPASHLGAGDLGKEPLREVARRLNTLPEFVSRRPKFGTALAAEWLDGKTELRRFAYETLADSNCVSRLGVQRHVHEFFGNGRDSLPLPSRYGVLRHLIWRLLLLTLWTRRLEVAW